MSKRPKDMTEEEREELPIGSMRARAVYWQLDDLLLWADKAGNNWTFGQSIDGSWFKKASPI